MLLRSRHWHRGKSNPEGPSTQYLRSLVPKTIPVMAFGASVSLDYSCTTPSEVLGAAFCCPPEVQVRESGLRLSGFRVTSLAQRIHIPDYQAIKA